MNVRRYRLFILISIAIDSRANLANIMLLKCFTTLKYKINLNFYPFFVIFVNHYSFKMDKKNNNFFSSFGFLITVKPCVLPPG